MSNLLHSEQQLLRDWAKLVVHMFNGAMCYQVGSSLEGEYRDIDVRTMLETNDFKALKKLVDIDRLNMAVSIWGQKVTAMPIDFQVQDRDYANKKHNGMRSAVGIGAIAKGDGCE